jgi:hypothetical protein
VYFFLSKLPLLGFGIVKPSIFRFNHLQEPEQSVAVENAGLPVSEILLN